MSSVNQNKNKNKEPDINSDQDNPALKKHQKREQHKQIVTTIVRSSAKN